MSLSRKNNRSAHPEAAHRIGQLPSEVIYLLFIIGGMPCLSCQGPADWNGGLDLGEDTANARNHSVNAGATAVKQPTS
jgi:hypothetical protein